MVFRTLVASIGEAQLLRSCPIIAIIIFICSVADGTWYPALHGHCLAILVFVISPQESSFWEDCQSIGKVAGTKVKLLSFLPHWKKFPYEAAVVPARVDPTLQADQIWPLLNLISSVSHHGYLVFHETIGVASEVRPFHVVPLHPSNICVVVLYRICHSVVALHVTHEFQILILPATSSFAVGFVTPIPTFPARPPTSPVPYIRLPILSWLDHATLAKSV